MVLSKSHCVRLVYVFSQRRVSAAIESLETKPCIVVKPVKKLLCQKDSIFPDVKDAMHRYVTYYCVYPENERFFIASRLTCNPLPAEKASKFSSYITNGKLITTSFKSFSVNKEEVPDNEQEKGTEKEMTERASEDTEMV